MGDICIFRDFYSYPEGVTRTLRVCTPDGYASSPGRSYPVLYLLDGQNVFAHPESAQFHTWCANEAMDALVAEGALEPWILVAIDHTSFRMEEYSPWPDPARGQMGRGWAFRDFLVNHLKPFVDSTWRTRTGPRDTAVIGSSMGGLMSLALGRTRPDVFGRIGAVSPSVMWAGGEVFRLWDSPTGAWMRLYLDTGDQERTWFHDTLLDYVESVQAFAAHLRRVGVKDHEMRFVLARDHAHHEQAWRARLPDTLRWLLAPDTPGSAAPTPR